MCELRVQQTKLLNNYLKDNPNVSRSKAIEILFGSSKGKADGKGITLERTQLGNDELNALAKEFYSIADDNSGSTTFIKMSYFLNTKITPDNIVGFLDAYEDAKRGDNSIIDTVMSEFTLFSNKPRNEVLTLINKKLCKSAEHAGVSDEDIAYARDAFNSNLGDTVEMEKAVKFLLGAIKSKQTMANTPKISVPDAMSEFTTMYSDTTNVANKIFEEARNEEGSIAKGADTVLGWFGCTTAEDMREKLGADAAAAEKLTQAAEAVRKNPQDTAAMKAFNDAYKETFGIEFDANKIAAREAAWTTYATAESLATTAKNIKATFFDRPVPKEYINFSQRIRQVTGLSNEELDAVIESYSTNLNMPAQTDEDKRQILTQYVQDLGKNITEQYNTVTQGKSLEQLKRDAELLDKSAFGTKDIVRDVIQYNENQAITAMVAEGGLEIAGTVALQFVPGLGQAASARLATSAAKWGNRGVKVANYLNKAEKGFAAVQKFQQGTKFTSKIANKAAQVASQSATAGTATAALGVIDGKDAKDIMRRTLMNMSFAGAGATSSVLAPKLMKSFGITDSALANEIAEEIINTAASYGITTLSGSDYTEADGFIDFATGLVMSRISHVKGGNKASAADASHQASATPVKDNPELQEPVAPVKDEPTSESMIKNKEAEVGISGDVIRRDTFDRVIERIKTDSYGKRVKYGYEYNPNGTVKKETYTDSEGNIRTHSYEYCSNGDIKKETVIDPKGNRTIYEYEYNPDGTEKKRTITESDGEKVIFENDSFGHLLKEIRKDSGGIIYFEYDYSSKQILKETKLDSEGNRTAYEYEYNSDGTVKKETCTDSKGNINVKEMRTDPNEKLITHEYERDSSGLLKKVVIDKGYVLTYEYKYDSFGRLIESTKTDPLYSTIKTYEYDASGRLKKITRPGVYSISTYEYDYAPSGRFLQNEEVINTFHNTISKNTYVRDVNGNITSKIERLSDGRTTTYSYEYPNDGGEVKKKEIVTYFNGRQVENHYDGSNRKIEEIEINPGNKQVYIQPSDKLNDLYPTPDASTVTFKVNDEIHEVRTSADVRKYLESYNSHFNSDEIDKFVKLFETHPKRFNRIANSGFFDLVNCGYIDREKTSDGKYKMRIRLKPGPHFCVWSHG